MDGLADSLLDELEVLDQSGLPINRNCLKHLFGAILVLTNYKIGTCKRSLMANSGCRTSSL